MSKNVKSGKVKFTITVEKADQRWCPDPHRRNGIVESKKIYNRKKAHQKGEPFDFWATL